MWFVPHLSLNKLVQAMCMESNKLTTNRFVRRMTSFWDVQKVCLAYLAGIIYCRIQSRDSQNDCFPESSSKDIQPTTITCILFHSDGNYYVMSENEQFSTILLAYTRDFVFIYQCWSILDIQICISCLFPLMLHLDNLCYYLRVN